MATGGWFLLVLLWTPTVLWVMPGTAQQAAHRRAGQCPAKCLDRVTQSGVSAGTHTAPLLLVGLAGWV